MAKRLLAGNEIFAHAALEAGVSIVAGYPGTPATGVVETVTRQRVKGRAQGVYVEWSANEKVALEVCTAASMSGMRAMLACNSEGIAVAANALTAASVMKLRGGLVLLVADDPGPTSSQTEHDTRTLAQFAHVPVFDPATPQQGYEMVKLAFDLSETYSVPVVVRPTTRVCHESLFLDVEDKTSALPPRASLDGFAGFRSDGSEGFVADVQRWVLMPEGMGGAAFDAVERTKKLAHAFAYDKTFEGFNPLYLNGHMVEAGSVTLERNNPRAQKAAEDNEYMPDQNARLGIVCGGCSTEYALEALTIIKREAIRAGMRMPAYKLIQIGTPYPFPRRAATRFFKDLSNVLVIEELDPVIENELLKLSGTTLLAPRIHGKLTGEAQTSGENSTEEVARRIAAFFDEYASEGEVKEGVAASAASANHEQSLEPYDDYEKDDYEDYEDYDEFDDGELEDDEPYEDLDEGDLETDAERVKSHSEDSLGVQGRRNSIAKRLAALQKKMTFADLVEKTVGPEAIYSYGKALPERRPSLCAGCPHRATFAVLKASLEHLEMSGSEAIIAGDLGCEMLGSFEPLNGLDAVFCMGSSITLAQGFSTVNPSKKAIALIGDSAFFAAGMTGIANAVSNNRNVMIVVLDNLTTAMTGLQPNPATGVSLSAGRTRAIDIEYVLHALGIDEVHCVDPLDRASAEDACISALQTQGPSAVIMQSPCALINHNDDVSVVNIHKCTGCKRCITELGCPAISFDLAARGAKSGRRGQAKIDPSQCNGCGLCVQICPFQAIEVFRREEISLMDAFKKSASKSARHAMIATHIETQSEAQVSQPNETQGERHEEALRPTEASTSKREDSKRAASKAVEAEALLQTFGSVKHPDASVLEEEIVYSSNQSNEPRKSDLGVSQIDGFQHPSMAENPQQFEVESDPLKERSFQRQMELFDDMDPFEDERIEALEDFDASASHGIPMNAPEVFPQFAPPVQQFVAPNMPYQMPQTLMPAPVMQAPPMQVPMQGMPPSGMYMQFDAYGRPIPLGYMRPQMPVAQQVPHPLSQTQQPQVVPQIQDEEMGVDPQGQLEAEADQFQQFEEEFPEDYMSDYDIDESFVDESLTDDDFDAYAFDEENFEEAEEIFFEPEPVEKREVPREEIPKKDDSGKQIKEVALDNLFASGIHIDLGGDAS